ncbi:MAG: ABC transporter permease subunit [Anaerolineae bacterium]|nr:ABC transporter permease subunit [Anaerolineae bacterium]
MSLKSLLRLLGYLLMRGVSILATLAFGIFLVVVVMNQSGFIDDAVYTEARNEARAYLANNQGKFDFSNSSEREKFISNLTDAIAEEAGVNLPYWQKQLRWTWNMLTFQWGDVKGVLVTDAGSRPTFSVSDGPSALRHRAIMIIAEFFPDTLLIVGVAYFFVFALGLPLSLRLARSYNSLPDRLVTALAPLSAIPSWVYGIILITIFAIQLHWFPIGGKYDPVIPQDSEARFFMIARHSVLPIIAIFLSVFFQLVYTWRTYFLLYAQEDYVELAIAKGLPRYMVEWQYIFRPTLPYILTSFLFMLAGFWQMTTALEYFFSWPGIGFMYIRSLLMDDLIVTLGVVVIFAYFLGGIVLFLDIAYLIIDPRIRYTILTQPQNTRGRLVTAKSGSKRKLILINLRLPRISIKEWGKNFREWFDWTARPFLLDLRHSPASLLSLGLIGALVVISALAPFIYPYDQLETLWNSEPLVYKMRPELARPVWFNWFLTRDLPENIIFDSRATPELKSVVQTEDTVTTTFTYTFELPDGGFPQSLYLFAHTQNAQKEPFMLVTWFTPDGREIKLKNASVQNGEVYDASENVPLKYLDDRYRRLSLYLGGTGESPHRALFADPLQSEITPLGGQYQAVVEVIAFNPDAKVDLEFVLLGQAYGWAGTDHRRREIGVGLLWGLPIALGIGTLGAVTTSLIAMFIAAAGAWAGGWIDALIQRMTEVNMMLPTLAIGVLLAVYFDISMWTVLAIAVLLNAFGGTTRSFRAAFLQVKEAPYIEAALTYGASGFRIITQYMIPRIFSMAIPLVVMSIPGYVFLEATLAIFELNTSYIPTWGGIIYDAVTNGAMRGQYYWLLQPIGALLITSLVFSMLGFSLDRILNPRLRSN